MSGTVIQLRVTLKDIRPPIWRKIIVPADYTFAQLHLVLQSVMGWKNNHPYSFFMRRRFEFKIPKKNRIADYFKLPKDKVIYQYDFGDNWEHEVVFENCFPAVQKVKYPICVKGKRAGPPEDCGGPDGYYELLESIKNPAHPEHDQKLQWLRRTHGDFTPEVFQPPTIKM